MAADYPTNTSNAPAPTPVMGLYDQALWDSIRRRAMALQHCADCGHVAYPPAPCCSRCLSPRLDWRPVGGEGSILSWTVFHKTYLPAYPAPYNVIAVRLDEGPVFISNLEGEWPQGSWIGRRVRLVYACMPAGEVLPRFVLASTKAAR